MSPNEALAIVKAKVAASPAYRDELTATWNRVCDAIEERALSRRPKPRSFEVHHETVTARAAMFIAIAEGKPMRDGEVAALRSVGI